MKPVFVGGTGRSGTQVTAKVLGAHPTYYMIPTEVRFIAAAGGLCDLIQGDTDVRRFEKRLMGRWFKRDPGGLHRFTDRATVEAVFRRHRKGLKSDPRTAAVAFTHDLLDPVAAAHGATSWVEMTPANVTSAPVLYELFPGMRLVHSVRDGRDVACSVVSMRWGPTDLDQALDWWAMKVEAGFAACDRLPSDRLLVMQMESLVATDRDAEYARLLGFCGLEDDVAMRSYFESEVSGELAHVRRWLDDVPPDRMAAFQQHYERLALDLMSRGRAYVADATRAAANDHEDAAAAATV